MSQAQHNSKNQTVLVTCGCSWTYGVGAGYQNDMSESKYMSIAWDENLCNTLSFRGILSNKYGFHNINFAEGASSNQRQFRLLKNFLASDQFKQLINNGSKIIVLHGITSTARNEMYLNDQGSLVNFKYDNVEFKKYAIPIIEYFYNHNNEVARLAEEMNFINQYYKATSVKNLWFDTFNHHQYPLVIDNIIQQDESNRDLLSSMASLNGLSEFDNNYHKSSWDIDSNRVQCLIDSGHLNPISKHPTKQGHELIANIISQYLEKVI
jgi:hypothetical protein